MSEPPQPDAPPAALGEPRPAVAPEPRAEAEPGGLSEAELALLRARPSYRFFGIVAAVSLLVDIASKAWAEVALSKRAYFEPSIVLVKDHLFFTLAYNKGGAWGLLQNASESVRKPFFLAVSVLAIGFIFSLYGKLAPTQHALRWGLPLVLGGALGNLSDRITRSSVVDFIDYRADWVGSMNALVGRFYRGWGMTDHWPTFNVADIAICIGVGLMAVDMVTSRRGAAEEPPEREPESPAPAGDGAGAPPAAG